MIYPERFFSLVTRLSFCVIFAWLYTNGQVAAQTSFPYQLESAKEGIILGSSLGVYLYAGSQYKKVQPLSFEDLSFLDRNDVLAIDRPATYNRSIAADTWSDRILYTSLAPPLAMVMTRSKQGLGISSVLLLETLLLNNALTDLSKILVRRNRPYMYNEFTEAKRKLRKKSRMSFFSGHSSTVAAMYVLSAQLFEDYYPQSKWKTTVWASAILIPTTTALLRVKAGKHYFTDVLAGLLVGGTIGFLIPELHRL